MITAEHKLKLCFIILVLTFQLIETELIVKKKFRRKTLPNK